MKAKKFKFIVKVCSILSAALVFTLIVVAISQFVKLGKLSRRKTNLESELEFLAASELNLRENIQKYNDINYTEQYAREHLGFISDGDIIYEIE